MVSPLSLRIESAQAATRNGSPWPPRARSGTIDDDSPASTRTAAPEAPVGERKCSFTVFVTKSPALPPD